ncbi:MAG: outer membrane beta-barrel protein [Hyphomicrobiaceae bacterium]|nr:outer membrane beta-barrel protein [Hyphomicrobiaceae bacterium]
MFRLLVASTVALALPGLALAQQASSRTQPAQPILPNFAAQPTMPVATADEAQIAGQPAAGKGKSGVRQVGGGQRPAANAMGGTATPWLGGSIDPQEPGATEKPAEVVDFTGNEPVQPGKPGKPVPGNRTPSTAATKAKAVPPTDLTGSIRPTSTVVTPTAPMAATQPVPRSPALDPYAEPTEDDGYTPLGLRLGTFTIKPTVEIGGGYTSNVSGSSGGRGGSLYRVNTETTGASDWSRHALDFTLRGSFTGYPAASDQNNPTLSGNLKGRIDITELTRADVEARLSRSRESSTSANNPAGTSVPSTILGLGASAGVTHAIGRLSFGLRGDLDRTTYSGGELAGGGAIGTIGDRDNFASVVALRSTYEISPAVKPYVELQYRRRDFDKRIDSAGYARSGSGWGLRTGVALDNGSTLKGELGMGYVSLSTDDVRLGDLRGVTIDGSLAWSPTRLTTATLTLATALEPTTVANSAGTVAYTGTVALSHALRRNLAVDVSATTTRTEYQGVDLTETSYGASAGLTWKFNREAAAFVRGTYTRETSSTPGSGSNAVEVYTGLRLSR